MDDTKEKDEGIKEEFCAACVAVPMALVGTGASAAGAQSKRKYRKWLLWGGLATVLLSVFITVYVMWIRKCDECTS